MEADLAAGVIGARFNRSNIQGAQSRRVPLKQCPYLHAEERRELLAAMAWTVRLRRGYTISSWVNCCQAQASNRAHVHPGAELSGVLHVQVPEGSGALVFCDPRPQCVMSMLGRKLGSRGQALLPRHPVQPEAGTLLLFPSWLMHEVEPGTHTSGLRIALSFDIHGLASPHDT